MFSSDNPVKLLNVTVLKIHGDGVTVGWTVNSALIAGIEIMFHQLDNMGPDRSTLTFIIQVVNY